MNNLKCMINEIKTHYGVDVVREALQACLREEAGKIESISCSSDAKKHFQANLAFSHVEVFGILYLNNKNKILAFETQAGDWNAAHVYPRQIAKRALELNAMSVILGHNHPSGSTEPSSADINMTKKVSACLEVFSISLYDHIIVTQTEAVSLMERGDI